eukprot:9214783-Alexandrium_andersonii.AAC.1
MLCRNCQTQGARSHRWPEWQDTCVPAPDRCMFRRAACGLRRSAPARPRRCEALAPVRLRSGRALVRHPSGRSS